MGGTVEYWASIKQMTSVKLRDQTHAPALPNRSKQAPSVALQIPGRLHACERIASRAPGAGRGRPLRFAGRGSQTFDRQVGRAIQAVPGRLPTHTAGAAVVAGRGRRPTGSGGSARKRGVCARGSRSTGTLSSKLG
jgi:hypothetical protein